MLLITQAVSLMISLGFVFIFLQFSLQTFSWAIVIDAVISYSIVSFCIGKYLKYSLFSQIRDWGLFFVIAMLVAYLTSVLARFIILPIIAEIIVFFILNMVVYLAINAILRIDVVAMVVGIAKSKLKRGKNE